MIDIERAITDDEWLNHVANGEAFVGEALQGAVGGQTAYCQILNPAGSGVRVRLRSLEPMPIFAIPINTNIARHDTPLTTNAPFVAPHNLLGSGGAAPLAELRNQSVVGIIGSRFWLILSAGTTRKSYPALQLSWGHDLLPSQGLILNSGVGGFILCGFMWSELAL